MSASNTLQILRKLPPQSSQPGMIASFRTAVACCSALGLVLVLLGPPVALAQEDGEEKALYEIAPREIEIRGRLDVDLPSLERLDLESLTVTRQVPALPPDRAPYTGASVLRLDGGPLQLPEPSVSIQGLTPSGTPVNAALSAEGGRYFTRRVQGNVFVPLSASASLEIQGHYDGSEGFEPFSGTGVETPYDNAEARARFDAQVSEDFAVTAGVHGAYDSYTLYGQRTPFGTSRSFPVPDRQGYAVGASAALDAGGRLPASLQLRYDQAGYETDRASTISFDEGRFAASGSLDIPLPGTSPAAVDAAFATAGFDDRGAFGADLWSLDAGGHAPVVETDALTASVGARVLTYSGPNDPLAAMPSDVSATYVVPTATLTWTARPNVSVFARLDPQLRANDLTSLHATNPFVVDGPTLLPTVETTRAEAGLRVSTGLFRLTAQGGYRYAPSHLYFAPASRSAPGVFSAFYDSAQILEGSATAAFQGSERLQASLRLAIRDGTLTGPDVAIPNFARVRAEGMVATSFAGDRGFAQLTASLLGPRPTDRTGDAEVGTFFDLDLEGSFAVSPLIDVLVGLENIGGGTLERWQRYPRPPTVVTTGLRVRW